MFGKALRGQSRIVIAGLGLAGLLVGAPRHAWAQG
jgi:hypothetical protein